MTDALGRLARSTTTALERRVPGSARDRQLHDGRPRHCDRPRAESRLLERAEPRRRRSTASIPTSADARRRRPTPAASTRWRTCRWARSRFRPATPARQLLGEGAGTIDAHGVTATVDILLVSNAVTPPVTRFDANNYRLRHPAQRLAARRLGRVPHRRRPGPRRRQRRRAGAIRGLRRSRQSRTADARSRVRQQGLAGLNVTRKVVRAAPRLLRALSRDLQQPDGAAGDDRRSL